MVASIILFSAAIYIGVGLLFAVWFIGSGMRRIDPGTHGAPLGFRLLLVPGATALWPVMLMKEFRS